MEAAWRQGGRGRGRARLRDGISGRAGATARPPSAPIGRGGASVQAAASGGESSGELSSQKKFDEIKKANQAAARKLVEEQFSSSSEEDDEDAEVKQGKILAKTFTIYTSQTDGDASELERTRQYMNEAFQSGAMTCLICIASVKRNQAVWSCSGCFCIFHLVCIQKWAKDSLFLVSSPLTDDDFGKKDHPWPCPKCRFEYKRSETPNKYYCYCGKVENPTVDPWLVPHSCGQICEREFKPPCGHKCLLLCHPGPCPPCPKMVTTSCHCKKAKPVPRRCSAKEWSCRLPCGRMLLCGQHTCANPCHSGDCQPCPRVSKQQCICGRQTAERLCASPQWQCDQLNSLGIFQVCGKALPCGNHTCEQVCHAGPCGDCPRSGKRFCPCGKSKFTLPCTEDVPTCGDSCDKVLECGIHKCLQRCHRGPCEICRQCCSGNCPPCDQVCGRTLGCRNHRCPSGCHRGSCNPCPEIVDVKCNCGKTVIKVPCGRERTIKPPKCKQLCSRPPTCHHPTQEKHYCHFGRCPPCRQSCQKTLTCGHLCPVSCHDEALVKQTGIHQFAGPWEQPSEPAFIQTALPCPPCEVPIPVECLGQHEVSPLPCHSAGPYSCKRFCGRLLGCQNHTCMKECHRVTKINSSADEKKVKTELKILAENIIMKQMTLQRKLTSADVKEKDLLTSCKNQCPKQLPCGHRCKEICHSGCCPLNCSQKVKLKCPCKRLKKVKEAEAKAAIEEEKRRQQAELEAFENRLKGRRKNKRRRDEVEIEQSSWQKYKNLIMLPVFGVAVVMVAWLMVYND
ncbi:UNVERIFIED_CONTAM: hypothetical protein H355_003028 [Colinus virginianus]|nr:hypothetical protein H355_003028 [Colinus virginianus]